MQSLLGVAWVPAQAVLCSSNVRDLPIRRYVQNNSLSGTLPSEWRTMTALTAL
jgi:hypothetical protein